MIEELSLLSSNDEDIRVRAYKIMTSRCYFEPTFVLDNLSQVQVYLLSLFPSFESNAGIIMQTIKWISMALKNQKERIIEMSEQIIKLSYEITLNVFALKSTNSTISTYPLSNILQKSYFYKGQLTYGVIRAISEHCCIGFLPDSSLTGILEGDFDSVVSIIEQSNPDDIRIFIEPISSDNPEIRSVFISLIAILIRSKTHRMSIMHHLDCFIPHLFSEIDNHRNDSLAAKVLLNCLRSTESEFSPDYSTKISDSIITSLSLGSRKYSIEDISFKPKNHFLVQKTSIHTYEQTGFFSSKRWCQCFLVLVEQAKLIMWSKNPFIRSDGAILHFSEVEKIELKKRGYEEGGMGNIMIMYLYPKGEKIFAFNSYEEAIQWKNIFKQNSIK